ncbi:hypothetical protein Angca_003798 [Angiostrongylus cantonensis]|nr:hypothetical protein Angca_003798 [Angiostrongylus cantonensis]
MQPNEAANELECRKERLDFMEYPLYRVVQVIYTLLSLLSLPLLLYVQIKYISGTTFHWNLKIILFLYYSLALLHSTAYLSIQIYTITSSLVSKPCDFFPPPYLYASLHLCIIVSGFGMTFTLAAMGSERIVATIRSNKYERNGITLGLFLFVLTVTGLVAAVCYVYDIDDFDVRVLSMTNVPPASSSRFNRVAVLNTTIGIVCIVMFHVSYRISKKQCSVSITTLTSRYQTRENVITTQFATHIATLQVTFFVFYGAGSILTRVFDQQFFLTNKKLYISLRHIFYVIPIFSIVLPTYSIYRLKCYRILRDRNIQSIIMMKSQGAAGSRNYEEVIARSWQHDQHREIHN